MAERVEDDDNITVLLVEDEEYKDPYIKVKAMHNSDQEISGNEIFNAPVLKDQEDLEEEYITEYLEEDGNGEDSDLYNIEFLDCSMELEKDEYENDHGSRPQKYKKSRRNKRRQQKTPRNQKKKLKTKQQAKSPQNVAPNKKTIQNYVSYVKELRNQYPKMAEDEQFLVECLAGVMRKITPPDPPENYCKVIFSDGKNNFECSFCGAQRDTLALAARHYQFKHGEMYLTCFACGSNYKNTTSLYKHEKRCRAPDAALVLRARGLYLGRKGRGRPFTTSNRFVTSNMLTLKNAKNSKVYCTKCPASFMTHDKLEAHENLHEGVRPYRCAHCTISFTAYPALKRHLAAMHGDALYICDHCGKKFRVKPSLISHLNVHRPLRKHPCLYCDRRFAQKVALQHHMNKVHLNLPAAHGCPVCPKRYARLTHVKEHMDRKHGLTMIAVKSYFDTSPTMTEQQIIQQITHENKISNFGANAIAESNDAGVEYIIPEIGKPTTDDKEDDFDQDTETEEHAIITDETVETKVKQKIEVQSKPTNNKPDMKISTPVKSPEKEISNDRVKCKEIDEHDDDVNKIKHKTGDDEIILCLNYNYV